MASTQDGASKQDEILARADRLGSWGFSYSLLVALAFTLFLWSWDNGILGTVLPFITYIPRSEAPVFVSLTFVGYGVGALVMAFISDMRGRRTQLMVTALILTIGGIGGGLGTSLGQELFFRFIVGIGLGADITLVATYLTEMAPSKKRGSLFNLIAIIGFAGSYSSFFSNIANSPAL